MLQEVNVTGIYFAPIVVYALVAIPIFLVARWLLTLIGFWRVVWHPALFETALYVSILASIILF
jgi:hypothetical protein